MEGQVMTARACGIFPSAVAVGIVLILGSHSLAFAKKGTRISVADDPSLKNGSPGIVLVEVSDFQ
jgi:hypothetical protein